MYDDCNKCIITVKKRKALNSLHQKSARLLFGGRERKRRREAKAGMKTDSKDAFQSFSTFAHRDTRKSARKNFFTFVSFVT